MNPKTQEKLYLLAIAFGVITLTNAITCLCWQHEAVLHHSAFFEANSWGLVSFHWNDVSFAQEPFQDEGWQKIMDGIFQKKLKTLGLQ
jgi:hypothetical protein